MHIEPGDPEHHLHGPTSYERSWVRRPGGPRGDQRDSDARARSNNPGCLQAPDTSLTFGLNPKHQEASAFNKRHAGYFIPQG